MPTVIYWGEGGQFGPFDVQEDGWPNAGQVMRYFREKRRLTAKRFGKLYGKEVSKDQEPISERWILEMELENKVPIDITRRRIIARLLGIPPVLFGLASLEDFMMELQKASPQPEVTRKSTLRRVSIDIAKYEKNVRLALHLHRTSNAQELLQDIHTDIRDLATLKDQAKGDFLYRVGELLASNNLLASRIVRDQRQYARAYNYANHAVLSAKSIEDEELLATAKHTRGLVKLAWGQFGTMQQGRFQVDRSKVQEAARDFQDILNKATRQPGSIHPQLQGFTQVQLSRAFGVLKQGRYDPVITSALTLVEQVADTVDRQNIDDLYTRAMLTAELSGLHLGGYLLHRANIFNTLGLPGKALIELNRLEQLAERTYGKNETRSQAWRDIIKAEAFMGLEEYQEATDLARDALIACHHIHSVQNIATIIDIHSRLAISSYGTSPDVKELGNMLKEWYEDEYRSALSSDAINN
jgi:hypothetical protein